MVFKSDKQRKKVMAMMRGGTKSAVTPTVIIMSKKSFAIGTASPSKALELSEKLDKKGIENAVFDVGISKKVIVFNAADKKKVAKIPGIVKIKR